MSQLRSSEGSVKFLGDLGITCRLFEEVEREEFQITLCLSLSLNGELKLLYLSNNRRFGGRLFICFWDTGIQGLEHLIEEFPYIKEQWMC
nr:MAG: p12 protein [Grapevine leafroll-associated virus 7]